MMGRLPYTRVGASALLLLVLTAGGGAQAPAADLLARFLEKAGPDLTAARDCTCLETMERGRRRPPHTDFAPIDTVRVEVSTIKGKELFASPGHAFDDRGLQSLIRSGAIGSGMYSAFVQNLFVKRRGTLRYVRHENESGRHLVRYDFRATRQESGFKLQVANIAEMVAAKGSFWFDADSLDLARLEIHSADIPYDLHLDDAVVRVEYARTRIGDSDALLPKRSEMTLTYISGDADRNVILFSQCREYRSDSSIDFGKGSHAPKAFEPPAPAEVEVASPPPVAPPPPVLAPVETKAAPLPAPSTPPPPLATAPALPTTLPAVSFQSEVNLVTAPVVVRDRNGKAIDGLRKEDFRLFDDGRKQEIAYFNVQRPANASTQTPAETAAVRAKEEQRAVPAERLVAYVFDDVDIKFEDLVRSRDAAGRNISESLRPSDRVAIVATSGRTLLDFTSDRAKIHDALFQLRPNSIYRPAGRECPDLNFYQAYAIESGMAGGVKMGRGSATQLEGISPLLRVAIEDLENCDPMFDPTKRHPDPVQENMAVEAAATRVVAWREREIDVVFNSLQMLARRMASMSGQRSIILASPGFLVTDALRPHEMELIDEAVRSGVVINALDALGLWTMNPAGEIGESAPAGAAHPRVIEEKFPFRRAEIEGGAQALAVLAEDTGGKFIQNSNDFIGAYRQLGNPPEVIYILGFSPQKVKADGKFHRLSVKLAGGGKFELQARSGYYAPKAGKENTPQIPPEIKDAVFAQLEIRTLPLESRTEVDSSDTANRKLTVTVALDREKLQVTGDRLNAVVALFDDDGNFIAGHQGALDVRKSLLLKTAFAVKAGGYRVRLVILDEQAQVLEARNQAVTVR